MLSRLLKKSEVVECSREQTGIKRQCKILFQQPARFAIAISSVIALGLTQGDARAQAKIAVGKVVGGVGLHIPSYIAMDKGFFKEEGIDHKIVDGGPGKNPIPLVAVGQAQCANARDLVAAVLEGGYNLATLPSLVATALEGFTHR